MKKYKLSIEENELNELLGNILVNRSFEQSLDKITNVVLKTPLSRDLINRQEYAYLREKFRIAIQEHGNYKRKVNEQLYSIHPMLVTWNYANLCVRRSKHSKRLDIPSLDAMSMHDIPEEGVKRSFENGQIRNAKQQDLEELAERITTMLANDIETDARVSSLDLPREFKEYNDTAIKYIKKLTFILPEQFFQAVDEIGRGGSGFEPKLVICKMLDRRHNMRTMDEFRTIDDDFSFMISEDNLNRYPISERIIQCFKSIYLMHRATYSLGSDTFFPHRREIRKSYGGIGNLDGSYIKNYDELKGTEITEISQFSGLWGSTYFEVLRQLRTIEAQYKKNPSKLEELSDITYKVAQSNISSVKSESDLTDDLANGMVENMTKHIVSRREHLKKELDDPVYQYCVLNVYLRILEEKLLNPEEKKIIEGFNAKKINTFIDEYKAELQKKANGSHK